MHAVLLSRPQEVIMSHRIAAGACALALLVPAAASAMPPPNDMPASYGGPTMVGDTKSDLHTTQAVTAPARGTESLDAMTYEQLAAAYGVNNTPSATRAYASAPALGTESLDAGSMTDKQLAAAYGINNKPEAAPAHAAVASASDDATNGWRIAAVVEAGVLAAFAVGAAVLLTGRQRRLRMGQ
jgi:hypothetical protein